MKREQKEILLNIDGCFLKSTESLKYLGEILEYTSKVQLDVNNKTNTKTSVL